MARAKRGFGGGSGDAAGAPTPQQATQAGGRSSSPEDKGYTNSEEEKALAKRFKKRISFFGNQMKPKVARWKENREYVDGDVNGDSDSDLVRVNLAASVVNTIQPNIYAKAPEAAVQPQERITAAEYGGLRTFARTLELALNRFAIRDTLLKGRGKEAVRQALTSTTGWVKVIYQKDIREDPLIRNRINDAQDNIQRLRQLIEETEDPSQCQEHEAKVAEMLNVVAALEKQVEVTHAEGLVIDNVLPEHVIILDNSVRTIDEYTQASAIAHGVFMTVRAYKSQFGGAEPPKKAIRYGSDVGEGEASQGDRAAAQPGRTAGIDPDDELVLVWEIWSKDDQTIYTQCDGAEEFSKPPYQPPTLGEQWYGLFPLQLWRVAGKLYARALVDNLRELVDEYNTRRTNAAEHRRKNLPVRMLNTATGIKNEEIDRINRRGATTDIIAVSADPDVPLQNQLGHLPEIPYNPAMYDTADIMRVIEMVSGAQDGSRGGVNKAKTTT